MHYWLALGILLAGCGIGALRAPGSGRRYEAAALLGRAVISREYRDRMLDGFRMLGPEAVTEFEATTDSPSCPVVELERVDVPTAPTVRRRR